MNESAKSAVEAGAYLFAGVAVVSFLQAFALIVTILAGIASLTLAGIRIHDRLKYGRPAQ